MVFAFLKRTAGATREGSPLKAGELHRLALDELGPVVAALGFNANTKSRVASWTRAATNDRWTVMWLQPSRHNDRFSAGFAFTIEFALSSQPGVGGDGYRERLPELLSDDEREELRRLENVTLSRLPSPDSKLLAMFSPETRNQIADQWRPRKAPYPRGQDIWFRQGNEQDARDLMAFFQRVLPSAIARFQEHASSKR